MIAPDREGAAVEALAGLLAGHDGWDYGGPGVIECECGWKSERLGPEWNSRRHERHHKHVAAVIAAGWVPQSEVAERERTAAEKALRDAADAISVEWTAADFYEDWLRDRADRLGGDA